jgi:hypothetical protein
MVRQSHLQPSMLIISFSQVVAVAKSAAAVQVDLDQQ